MATITKSYAEQLSDLKALEELGSLPSLASQTAAAEALLASEGRPFATRDGKYVILATDNEMAEAIAARDAEIAAQALLNHPDTHEANALAALDGGGRNIDISRLLKAKFVSDLAFRLGKAPGALTGAELSAERNRIAAIYKAL